LLELALSQDSAPLSCAQPVDLGSQDKMDRRGVRLI
jgi:hypothetical protein